MGKCFLLTFLGTFIENYPLNLTILKGGGIAKPFNPHWIGHGSLLHIIINLDLIVMTNMILWNCLLGFRSLAANKVNTKVEGVPCLQILGSDL